MQLVYLFPLDPLSTTKDAIEYSPDDSTCSLSAFLGNEKLIIIKILSHPETCVTPFWSSWYSHVNLNTEEFKNGTHLEAVPLLGMKYDVFKSVDQVEQEKIITMNGLKVTAVGKHLSIHE